MRTAGLPPPDPCRASALPGSPGVPIAARPRWRWTPARTRALLRSDVGRSCRRPTRAVELARLVQQDGRLDLEQAGEGGDRRERRCRLAVLGPTQRAHLDAGALRGLLLGEPCIEPVALDRSDVLEL